MDPVKAYFIFLALLAFVLPPLTHAASGQGPATTAPTTYRLFTLSAVRSRPDGEVIEVWDAGTTFTSTAASGEWVRISGWFPDGRWEKNPRELWVRRDYARMLPNRPAPAPPSAARRYIVVSKSDFSLKVFERNRDADRMLYQTKVALGMDRCLPEEQGGRCYYTDPGEYKVRWKVHDPEGIEWCIPKSMEKEYPESIAAGERCFRGPIGTHALNIGKTYAIHGTNKPETLGQRASHGCIRADNPDMERIYQLMAVGDPVYIRD